MSILVPRPTLFDMNFRLFRTAIRVSGWFWLLPTLWYGWIALLTATLIGWSGFLLSLGHFLTAVSCLLFSILLHEFGHVVAGRRFGADGSIVLNGIGGAALGSAEVWERWQRIVVFLAGPLAQLLFAGLVAVVLYLMFPFGDLFENGYDSHVWRTLMLLRAINIVWPLLNLLPIPPLDGYHVALELMSYWRERKRAAWEQNPDWWKAGSPNPESYWTPGIRGPDLTWLAISLMVVAVVLLIGWRAWKPYG